MTRPVVSVVIHFLDAERYLDQALRSVWWQTHADWELVLVDGGSTDDSAGIAEAHVRRDPQRVRLIRPAGPGRLGIFSSRIRGATEARAAVLAHLDADDEWHPQFLARQLALHRRFFASRPGLVYGPMVYWWEEPALSLQSYVQPVPAAGLHEPPHLLTEFLRDGYARTPGNSSVVVSREIVTGAVELIGEADEGMVEDQFLWSWVAAQFPICVNPEPLSRYRQWDGSVCARTISSGSHADLAREHLEWLRSFVGRRFTGPVRDRLLAACRDAAAAPAVAPP